jgi:hypothetical protein
LAIVYIHMYIYDRYLTNEFYPSLSPLLLHIGDANALIDDSVFLFNWQQFVLELNKIKAVVV